MCPLASTWRCLYVNPNTPLLMLVLAFSEHITVVLTYIGAFSLVAFPLPGNLFFMIFRWFTFLLHKSQVLPEPLSEKLHFLPSSFSITLPSFIFLHNISLPVILSSNIYIYECMYIYVLYVCICICMYVYVCMYICYFLSVCFTYM